MNIWIVTTGSSDVKLKTDENWGILFRKVRNQLYNRQFKPTQPPNTDDSEPFIVPARAMGMVYGTQLTDEYYQDLHFPLLDAFSAKLLEKDKTSPDRITVILTNQEAVFDEQERRVEKSPYWQDTCTLKVIFAKYFQKNFPRVESIDYLELQPKSKDEGLDNWDKALVLVQQTLSSLDVDKNATVYVSHQAGTPAISSAVQFVSLGKFGTKVKFLVSNEYEKKALEPIESSEYLKGIKFEQAKALLENHDYAAVQSLVKDYLGSETQILLDAAIEWNYAKFDEFAKKLQKLSDEIFVEQVNKRSQKWWWTAYEAAYLAIIRHEQTNIVEALFHSFRSVEGLVCKWAEEKYKQYIYYDEKGSPQIQEEIQDILPEYWEKIKNKNSAWIEDIKKQNENRQAKGKEPKPISVGLFSQNLYLLLEYVRPECKKDPFLKKGLYSAKDERNQQFHRLLGLREKDLFKAWKADDVDSWKFILLGCLNFIAKEDSSQEKEDLPQDFTSLEEASLMKKVHKELVKAIARYELQT